MSASLVGSAFARLNPPMNAQVQPVPAVIEQPGETPLVWLPAAQQPNPQYSAADVATLMSDPAPQDAESLEEWRQARSHGIVTLINEWWAPQGVAKSPPSTTTGLGMYLSAQWCYLFNVSPLARRKGRWALVAARGTAIIISGISLAERPADPGAFPRCVLGGLTHREAEQAAIDMNRERLAVARVPREWTVAVRLASTVEQEGGAE